MRVNIKIGERSDLNRERGHAVGMMTLILPSGHVAKGRIALTELPSERFAEDDEYSGEITLTGYA
jgi:hypothetical protein